MKNPTRRNKKIGTKSSGFKKRKEFSIPNFREDEGYHFVENLREPVVIKRETKNGSLSIRFIVEAQVGNEKHACTVDDIWNVLCENPDECFVEYIILRRPTKKQQKLGPVWGRLIYNFMFREYVGSAIILESLPLNEVIKRPISQGPDEQREMKRLEVDGHKICKDKKNYLIETNYDTIRSTQLYRTLLHELGHYRHFHEFKPFGDNPTDEEVNRGIELYDTIPQKDKEDFAHRYADEMKKKLVDKKVFPFERIVDKEGMKRDGLNPDWFNAGDVKDKGIEEVLFGGYGNHGLFFYFKDEDSLTIEIAPFSDLSKKKRFVFNNISDYKQEIIEESESKNIPLGIISIGSTNVENSDEHKVCIHCAEIEINFISKWPLRG